VLEEALVLFIGPREMRISPSFGRFVNIIFACGGLSMITSDLGALYLGVGRFLVFLHVHLLFLLLFDSAIGMFTWAR
jgi:hypothetical protein